MKKINIKILFAILSVFIFAGCNDEVDNTFELSAEERVKELAENCSRTLISSELGWLMNQETGSSDRFLLLFKFKENNKVEISSDFFDEKMESEYGFSREEEAILNFSTYGMMALLADPSFRPKGKGAAGEIQLIVRKVTPDTIYFKGFKYGTKQYMVRATAENLKKLEVEPPAKMLKQVQRFFYESNAFFKNLSYKEQNVGKIELQGASSIFQSTYNNYNTKFVLSSGEKGTTKIRIIYTDTGFKLEKPLKIDDNLSISEFIYDEELDTFVAKENKAYRFAESYFPPVRQEKPVVKLKDISLLMYGSPKFTKDFLQPLKTKVPGFKYLILFNNAYDYLNSFTLWGNSFADANISKIEVDQKETDVVKFTYALGAKQFNMAGKVIWRSIMYETWGFKFYYNCLFNHNGFVMYWLSNDIYILIQKNNPDYWMVFTSL